MGANKRKYIILILISIITLPNFTNFLEINQPNFINREFLNFTLILNTLQTKYIDNYNPIPEDPFELFLQTTNEDESDDSFIHTILIKNFTEYHNSSQNVNYGYGNLNLTENPGIFQAQYNFKNDTIDSIPEGWADISTGSNEIHIIEGISGHNHTILLNDTGSGYGQAQCNFSDSVTGICEFYFRSDDVNERSDFCIYPYPTVGDGIMIGFRGDINGKLQYWDGTYWCNIRSVASNTWYHAKVHWNCTSGTWFIYVDDVKYGDYPLINSPSLLNACRSCTSGSSASLTVWIDSVDFNFSNNHYENRILNLESNFTNGYYTSKDIPICDNVTILAVDINSEKQLGTNITLEYYDFNTDNWLGVAEYRNTTQNIFKFRVNFSTDCYSNAFLYNLTLNYYNITFNDNSFIDRPIYMNQPRDIAIDSKGFIYVADTLNNRIKKFDSNGNFTLEWGSSGSLKGQFDHPYALDISKEWNGSNYNNYIYVADYYNHRIQKFDENGRFVLEWGEYGEANQEGKLKTPSGITIFSPERQWELPIIYVADSGNKQIRIFSPTGDPVGKWQDSQLSNNFKITVNSTNYLYLADIENNMIRYYDLIGNLLGTWGKFGDKEGEFSKPTDIAFDSEGDVHIMDSLNHRIQKFTFSGDYINESSWGILGYEEGEFYAPNGLVIDQQDDFYLADPLNYRIQKYDNETNFLWQVGTVIPELEIPTVTYIDKWSQYGNMNLNNSRGMAVDSEGNQYVCDSANNVIVKFDKFGNFIKKWGNGSPSVEYEFNNPGGITVDSDGYIYVADSGNNRIHIFSDSIYFFNFNTWAANDTFSFPNDLEVYTDKENRDYLYVVDKNNKRIVKFFIDKEVENREILGYMYITDWDSYEIEDEIHYFQEPYGIAIDSEGSLTVSDGENKSLIIFDSTGEPSSKINNTFNNPLGLYYDSHNRLYLIDTDPDYNNHSLYILTGLIIFAKIDINTTTPLDVCVDLNDNILITTNNSILKYRYLKNFPSLLSIIEPNFTQSSLNTSISPAFDKQGNIYALKDNLIYKFDNYGNYLATFNSGLNGTGTDIEIKNFENVSFLYHALHDDNGPEHVVIYALDGEKIYQINITNYDNLSSIVIDDNQSIYCLTNSEILKFAYTSGHYKGLFSFTNDTIGCNPSGWTVEETLPTTVQVVSEVIGHKKVVEMVKVDDKIEYSFGDDYDNGIVEFYIQSTDVNNFYEFRFTIAPKSGSSKYCRAYINNDHFTGKNGSDLFYICSAIDNTWYHFKVVFNVSSGWYLFINDIRYPTSGEYAFSSDSTPYSYIQFENFQSGSYKNYVDAVDFSWSEGYYEGRNKEMDHYCSLSNYNGSGEISSEGLKNQIEVDSLGNLYYLSHSTNEILKIDWEAQEISERWHIDQNLTEHQIFMDKKDNLYLLNKLDGEAQILKFSNESDLTSRYEFNYNESEDISLSIDYFRDVYIFKNISSNQSMLYKYGSQEIPPELTFQLTDDESWTEVIMNTTGYIFGISSIDNSIKIYNSSGYYRKTLSDSGLESPFRIDIDSNNYLIVMDSDSTIKIYDDEIQYFNTIIYEPNLNFIDFYITDKINILAENQSGNYYIRSYIYNLTSAELNYSISDVDLKLPTSICVFTNDDLDQIYITDLLDNKIKVIYENGSILREWGKYGSMCGDFIGPYKVVRDYCGGVYVLDIGNSRIQKFDKHGNFKSEWGQFRWSLVPNGLKNNIDLAINQNDILVLDSLRIDKFHYEFLGNDTYNSEDPDNTDEYIADEKIFITERIIEEGAEFDIPVIYGIIYDPPGTGSYGYIKKGSERYIDLKINLKTSYEHDMISIFTINGFGGGIGGGGFIEWTNDNSWRIYEKTTEEITSSKSNDKEFMGPGRGDVIWGRYKLDYYYLVEITKYNSKGEIIAPPEYKYYTWMDLGGEIQITMQEISTAFKNNTKLPKLLKALKRANLVYDNIVDSSELDDEIPSSIEDTSSIISILYPKATKLKDNLFLTGGGQTYTYEEENSEAVSYLLSTNTGCNIRAYVKLGHDWGHSIGYISAPLGFGTYTGITSKYKYQFDYTFTYKWVVEQSIEVGQEETKTMGYIFEDQPTRNIADQYIIDVYRDKRYQTLAFTIENLSKSHDPWEYYTRDNVPPRICEIDLVDQNNNTKPDNIVGETARIRVQAEDIDLSNNPESGVDNVILYDNLSSTVDEPIEIQFEPAVDGYFYFDLDITELGFGEGYRTIYTRAYDNYSNYKISEIQILIDKSSPHLVKIAPLVSPQLPGAIELYATANDTNDIAYVKYYDGDPDSNGEFIGTSYNFGDSWKFIWVTNRTDEGNHSIYVVAYDNGGNFADDGPSMIYIGDPDPPSKCIIIEPNDGEAKNGDVTIKVEVYDQFSGVHKVEFFIGDPKDDGVLMDSINKDPFLSSMTECEFIWDIDSVNDDLYEIFIVAYDNYSNNRTDKIHLYIDKKAPNVFNFTYGHRNNYSVEFWVNNLSDDLSGIAKVEYYKGSVKIGEGIQPDQFQFLWFGPNGTHDIWARAYDWTGNYTDSNNNETVIIIYGNNKGKHPILLFPKLNDANWALISQIGVILGSIGVTAILFIRKWKRKRRNYSKMLKKS